MRFNFNRQRLDRLPDITAQILDEVQFHLRRGNKAAQTVDGCSQAAFDDICNFGVNRLKFRNFGVVVVRLNRAQFVPNNFGISFDLGKDAAVFAAETLNINLNLVALLDDIFRRIGLRISEFLFRNRNFLLVAYVDKRLVAVDLNDGAFNDFMLANVLHVYRIFQPITHFLVL